MSMLPPHIRQNLLCSLGHMNCCLGSSEVLVAVLSLSLPDVLGSETTVVSLLDVLTATCLGH